MTTCYNGYDRFEKDFLESKEKRTFKQAFQNGIEQILNQLSIPQTEPDEWLLKKQLNRLSMGYQSRYDCTYVPKPENYEPLFIGSVTESKERKEHSSWDDY